MTQPIAAFGQLTCGSFLFRCLAALLVFALPADASEAPGLLDPPAYVGSAACASCHEDATRAWTGSDHQLAWTDPGPETVLGDFDNAEFTNGGVTTRFLSAWIIL